MTGPGHFRITPVLCINVSQCKRSLQGATQHVRCQVEVVCNGHLIAKVIVNVRHSESLAQQIVSRGPHVLIETRNAAVSPCADSAITLPQAGENCRKIEQTLLRAVNTSREITRFH